MFRAAWGAAVTARQRLAACAAIVSFVGFVGYGPLIGGSDARDASLASTTRAAARGSAPKTRSGRAVPPEASGPTEARARSGRTDSGAPGHVTGDVTSKPSELED